MRPATPRGGGNPRSATSPGPICPVVRVADGDTPETVAPGWQDYSVNAFIAGMRRVCIDFSSCLSWRRGQERRVHDAVSGSLDMSPGGGRALRASLPRGALDRAPVLLLPVRPAGPPGGLGLLRESAEGRVDRADRRAAGQGRQVG